MTFPSAGVAAHLHPQCESWSCRYLPDMHSIFDTRVRAGSPSSYCLLCNTFARGYGGTNDAHMNDREFKSHAESHSLRSCDQENFLDLAEFVKHLRVRHKACLPIYWSESYIAKAWHHVQFIERYGTKVLLRTLRPWRENTLCPSKQAGYTTQVVG